MLPFFPRVTSRCPLCLLGGLRSRQRRGYAGPRPCRTRGPTVPFRSKATLETWLEEFHRSREAGDLIRVAVQDGSEGADTGLVIVPLHNADISLYMEPIEIGDERWRVT